MEPLSLRQLWSDYWKVPVVGLLAAVLAFFGSFMLSPTYQSSTNLLVRARNATFLSGNGTSLTQTPAVLDSDLAKALSDTQSALVSSDTVARMVVHKLNLDKPKPQPNGPIAKLRRTFSSIYHHTKAFLMFGTYKTPPRFEGAVQAVNSGLAGAQVKDSFVLQLTAQADNPKLAAAIANAAADSLVTIANQRFVRDSASYRDLLKRQLAAAQRDAARTSNKVAAFQQAHGISDVSAELSLTAQNAADLQSRLQQTKADLSNTQAQLASIESQLSSTPAQASTSQQITTGRSSTTIDNTQTSPLYQSLRQQEATLRAQASGDSAQIGAIQQALAGAKPSGPLTKAQATLQQLSFDQQVAQQTVQSLATQYQNAKLNTVGNTVQLSRVDTAAQPTMPIGPRRYLYLAIGLVLGMVIGFVSAQLAILRRRARDEADGDGSPSPSSIDLREPNVTVPVQRNGTEERRGERTGGNGRPTSRAPEGER